MQKPTDEPKRFVGAAFSDPKCTRLIETLYRTKTPDLSAWCEQWFELTLGEEVIDGQLGYFVRETHCRWDADKLAVRIQYTLSPRGGFATIEEAHERYKLQRATRARRGYVHAYAPSYETTTRHRKYTRVEIPAATRNESKSEGS